jgi:hypothetical protein
VIMTPNAYMTDEAWKEVVPHLCKGIRSMKGIRDHPNFWVVLSLDGFGSHLDSESLLLFHDKTFLSSRMRVIPLKFPKHTIKWLQGQTREHSMS